MRKTMLSVVLVLTAAILGQVLIASPAQAQKHEKLYGLFCDIKGWKGGDPEGVAMDVPGMKMVQAMRVYSKGDKEITAIVIVGSSAATAAFAPMGEMNMESSDGKASVKEIDGFTLHIMYDKKEDTGGVTVILKTDKDGGAFFILSFEGMDDEEGLKIAKSFDWKEMKKKVESLD